MGCIRTDVGVILSSGMSAAKIHDNKIAPDFMEPIHDDKNKIHSVV